MSNTLAERHEKILGSITSDSFLWLWIKTALFGLFVFGISVLYVFFLSKKLEIFQVNQAAANVGTILISLSFLLTSLSFFFDRFDRLIIYRKHLGIIGFAYVVAHIIFILFLMPTMFSLNQLISTRIVAFAFGLVATFIFAIMTMISNRYMITTIGGATWRGFLRYGGYSALLFSLVHIWYSSSKYWQITKIWPLSMVVFVIGSVTILLRIFMFFSMMIKKR